MVETILTREHAMDMLRLFECVCGYVPTDDARDFTRLRDGWRFDCPECHDSFTLTPVSEC